MATLTSSPVVITVTAPLPRYVDNLVAFQSRELVGAYGPSGSFGKARPLDSALQGWATSKGGAYNQFITALICRDYCGGCEDRTNKRIHWGGDGGHASSACNGAFFYDVRDDGTGRPKGAYGVPGTFSALSDVPSAPVPSIWPDGRPNAAHTYLARGYCPTNNRHYKFGHLSAYVNGGSSAGSSPAWCNPDSSSHWPTNNWNTFERPGQFSSGGEGDWVMVSPDGTKALYGILKDGNQPARFYDMVTATWGKHTKVAINPQWNGKHQTYVWDSARNRALLITAGIGGQMDVDWERETLSNQIKITRTGDLLGLDRNSQSVWFDPDRFYLGKAGNTKGVIWCYGGRNPQSNMNDITEFDPINYTAVRYRLSGQIPQQAPGGGDYRGLMNRHVFVAEWRTVFFVTDMERSAYAVRLPDPTEDTSMLAM